MTIAIQTETVTPTPYERKFFHRTVSAIVIHDGETRQIHVVNNPEALYVSGDRLTIKGLRGTGTTFTSDHTETGIVGVYYADGRIVVDEAHVWP